MIITTPPLKSKKETNLRLLYIAVLAAIAAPASAADGVSNENFTFDTDTTLITNADSGESGNRFSGVAASTGDTVITLTNGSTLRIEGTASEIENASRLYAVSAQTGSTLKIDGNVSAELVASAPASARGIRGNGGDISINGDVDLTVKGDSSNSTDYIVGIDAWYGSDITFSGQNIQIEVTGGGDGRAEGIQNFDNDGAVISFNSDRISLKVDNASGTNYTHGISSYQSETDFNGDTHIDVQGNQSLTYGIEVQCDPGNSYGTSINFSGSLTEFNVSGDGQTVGIQVSGVPGIVDVSGGQFNIDAKSSGTDSIAVGISTQYGGTFSAEDPNTELKIHAQGAFAYGLMNSTYGGANTIQYGTIQIAGNTTIEAESDNLAVGIASEVDELYKADVVTEDDGIYLTGTTTVHATATGENAQAVGVISTNKHDENGVTPNAVVQISNLTVTATGKDGASAIGVSSADNGHLQISGSSSITASGADAVGAEISDADMTVSGSLSISGGTLGLSMDEGAELNVAESSSVAVNSMKSEGTTTLQEASQFKVVGTADGTSSLGTIKGTRSTVSVGAGTYSMTAFIGEQNILMAEDLKGLKSMTVDSASDDLTVAASGLSNDQYANAGDAYAALLDKVKVGTDATDQTSNHYLIEQGAVNDGLEAKKSEDGTWTTVVHENTSMAGFSDIAALSALTWRDQLNDLNKRMGDLRDQPNAVGGWARIYGAELEYGQLTNKSASIQVGADYQIGAWKLGGAFSYTSGSADYDLGDSDNDTYTFGLYGTWMSENGLYLDVIGKYGRISNDFRVNGMTGSYDNNALSFSAEAGWHLVPCSYGFIEPQVELTYGRIMGDTFTTSNQVQIDQDDFDSLIGRIGMRIGAMFPDNRGSIYFRVSGAYDFQGENSADVRLLSGASQRTIREDLGGAWLETAVGANFSFTDATNVYVDLERTNGGDVVENWRWNVGVRHVF